MTMEELKNGLFGISITTWIYENIDYSYCLGFEAPDKITFTYYVKENDIEVFKIKVVRNGTFIIENNILRINFFESQYDVYNTLGEWQKEISTIEMDVEIIERTKLILKQISGINIFKKNIENMELEFKANILVTLI